MPIACNIYLEHQLGHSTVLETLDILPFICLIFTRVSRGSHQRATPYSLESQKSIINFTPFQTNFSKKNSLYQLQHSSGPFIYMFNGSWKTWLSSLFSPDSRPMCTWGSRVGHLTVTRYLLESPKFNLENFKWISLKIAVCTHCSFCP